MTRARDWLLILAIIVAVLVGTLYAATTVRTLHLEPRPAPTARTTLIPPVTTTPSVP